MNSGVRKELRGLLVCTVGPILALQLWAARAAWAQDQCPFNIPVVVLPAALHPSGFAWSASIAPLGYRCTEKIKVDPTDEKLWYVSSYNGLYITRDGGLTWDHPLIGFAPSVALSPQPANEVYAGVQNTLHWSLDKGLTWKAIGTFSQAIRSVYVEPGGRILVGLGWGDHVAPNGLYTSNDGGRTWEFSSFGAGYSGLICWDIGRDTRDGALYVGTEIFDHPRPYRPPFFRSLDGGKSWQEVSGALPWHVIAIQVRPSDGYVYALTEGAGLYGSPNRGTTWSALARSAPGLSLLLDRNEPSRLYGGYHSTGNLPGGVFMSRDGGMSFQPIGLQGTIAGSLELNGDGTRLYAAAYASGIYSAYLPTLGPPPTPPIVHDVAIAELRVPATVAASVPTSVDVGVVNLGTQSETVSTVFSVGGFPLPAQTNTLAAGQSATVTFSWEPGSQEGARIVTARAVLPADVADRNPLDNVRQTEVQIQNLKGRLILSSNKVSYQPSESATLTYRLLDRGNNPVANQEIAADFTAPNGERWTESVTTDLNGRAVQILRFLESRGTGKYSVRIRTTIPDGATLVASADLVVTP